MTSQKSYTGVYFLGIVILAYILLFLFNSEQFYLAFKQSLNIILDVYYILIVIFVLMILTNYFLKPEILVKYLGKNSGFKGKIIAIIGGIISSGPIYMWYPMLNDLQNQGVKNGLIAIFLYNRAIKIPLLPMMIVYFSLSYTIILMLVMIVVSVLQGLLIDKLMEENN